MAHLRRQAIEGLERLAAPLRKRGLAVSIAAVWDYPPFESILRRAVAIGADLDSRTASRPASFAHIARLYGLGAVAFKSDAGVTGQEPNALSPSHSSRRHRSDACAREAKRTRSKNSPVWRPSERSVARRASRGACVRASAAAADDYLRCRTPQTNCWRGMSGKRAKRSTRRLSKTTIPASRRHLVRGGPVAAIPATARQDAQRHRRHRRGFAICPEAAIHRQHRGERHGRTSLRSSGGKPGKFALKTGRARRGPKIVSTALPALSCARERLRPCTTPA